jgi:hypothetical protein
MVSVFSLVCFFYKLCVVGCVVHKVMVGIYLLCRTVFPLVMFVPFSFLIGEVKSQIFYILRF